MSTHYCIRSLHNVCVSLYYFFPPLAFCSRFKIALYFHRRYLPIRIKVNSLALVSVVAHPVTSRLSLCVLKFTIPHSTVYGCSGSVSFMKTPRKFGISSCFAYLSSSKFDSGLSGIAISNTCILHGRVLTKLVCLRQSYISLPRAPFPRGPCLDGGPGHPPPAWTEGGGRQGPAGIGKNYTVIQVNKQGLK